VGLAFRLFLSVLAPALLLAGPVALVAFAVDRDPVTPTGKRVSFAEVKHAQRLLARYDPRKMSPHRTTLIRATERDLKAAFSGGVAVAPRLGGDMAVTSSGIDFMLTAELPIPVNPWGRYVNMHLTVAPSSKGLVISRLAMGRIEIPPGIVEPAIRRTMDHLIGPGEGKAIMESIRSVRVVRKTVLVAVTPPERIFEKLTRAARRVAASGDPASVRPYYNLLARHGLDRTKARQSSLVHYIRAVFALARVRSETGDPVAENRGAILALAMYFGHSDFERLIGKVRTGKFRKHRPRTRHVRLAGRNDLVRHFTVSAGLVLLGGGAVADLIGEAKEVTDSNSGSGFSFADLAADRAGVRFAESAVASTASARRLQAALSRPVTEAYLFPRALDQPEGMNERAFRRQYGDINHPDYDRLVAEIDRRIAALPLYR
jgi:hypothetical protein